MMLNSITLHPATRVPLAERTGVLNAAYADYHVPFHMTPDQVAGMDVLYDEGCRGCGAAGERGKE